MRNEPLSPAQNSSVEPSCICDALSLVYDACYHSELSDELFDNPSVVPSFEYLQSRLDLEPAESVLLSIIHERGEEEYVSIQSIAEYLGCSVGKVKTLKHQIDSLVNRRLIHSCYYGNRQVLNFFVQRDVLDAFFNNEAFVYKKPVVKDEVAFFGVLDEYFAERADRKIGIDELDTLISELMDAGKNIKLVRKLTKFGRKLTSNEQKLFLLLTILKYKNNQNGVAFRDYHVFFTETAGRAMAYQLLRGNTLIKEGLVEMSSKGEKRPLRCRYSLTEKVLEELDINTETCEEGVDADVLTEDGEAAIFDVVKASDIVEKELFYNEKEQREMGLLADLLSQEKYAVVQKGLKEKGLRGGMNILFYGGPGTGKTEGVRQLARKTGRDLMVVDFSQIRSRWVGDSEKNTKRVFDQYRMMVKKSKLAPILLLNEADGILGRRMESVEHSSDRMENTMQNILLQEMESLEGILIATTNLASTLDSAFDRRFIFKLGIEKPSAKVRGLMWKSMLPKLTDEQASTLAESFDIAGGNMENVLRKLLMEEILYQGEVPFDRVLEMCKAETVNTKTTTRRIGF